MEHDQRQHTRVDLSLETIYYAEDVIGDERDRMHYFGTITNMSKGGVGMVVGSPHEVNEELWLEGIGQSPMPLAGLVRWIRSYQGKYEMGLQFRSADA